LKPDSSVQFQKSPSLPFVEIRRASNSNACYHTHSHDEFSFGVIDTGHSTYQNRQNLHTISTGDLVAINPADAHSCNPRDGAWSYRMLFVDTQWLGAMQQELFGGQEDYRAFEWQRSSRADLRLNFNQLYQSLLQDKNSLEAETDLLTFISASFKRQGESLIQPKISHQQADKVRQLLEDELSENHSLDDLEKESGLSRYHLIRNFKKHFGQAPHAYQLDLRIKKAKDLLQNGNSLSDTAFQLGFADQAHFQRHFKKRIAVTPKQYQSFFVM